MNPKLLSKKTLLRPALIVLVLMAAGVPPLAAAMAPVNLQCEYRSNPLGLDVARPRLSWQVRSEERDQGQTAYEIQVADSREQLQKEPGNLWDSGKVTGDETVNLAYSGKPLASGGQCFWKVRVWDKRGRASDWSAPAMWSMGLLEAKDWQGKWIGWDQAENTNGFGGAKWIWFSEGNPADSAPVGTRYFRREFALPANQVVTAATITMTADNEFRLFVNGQEAGKSDNWKVPGMIAIGKLLKPGQNVLAVEARNIGDGPNAAGLVGRLKVVFEAGNTFALDTDGSWKSATNSDAGWNALAFDDSAWAKAKPLGDYGMQPWGTIGDEDRRLPARYLRHEFAVEKKVRRATAYVCGLGFFNLYLNGEKVSDDAMDPALSDYAKAAYYVTFDVTGQLKRGNNAVGVILGNGRFFAPRLIVPIATQAFGYPKLRLQLNIEYTDGTTAQVVSDEQWKLTTDGPIRANNEYDGEEYDARLEMPGWARAGFNDAQWGAAQVVNAPGGALTAQIIEPMRVTQIIHPVAITNPAPGIYIVDMGQNFYGTVRLKARGARGTEVRLISAYSLLPDGLLKTADNRGAKATDVYTFKGQGTEVWNPAFKGQGYRRVQVTGFPGTPTVDNFEGLVIHTDVKPAGEFECSNDLINRIHSAQRWGMRMFLRSAPLDPDRDERQAWMGDPAKDAESEAYNFNVAPFYTKWMDDVGRAQRTDGSIPDVAMYWTMGDGVEWASVFTIIPDWFNDFYGDRRVSETHYAAMKKWVLAMRRHELPDGTLKATSYGDWCDASTMDGKVGEYGSTPRELVSTAYHYNNCRIVERLAKALGHAEDERTFADMAEKLKASFNRAFLNPQTHVYRGGTQCGYVLALKFGLVPDGQREGVIANLIDDIMVKHQGHLSVGLIGMQWLMQTLTDIGRPDVAWTIATQTTRPSWGYMLAKGATTTWERWDCDTRDPGMNSEALLIQSGNLDAWFYQTLAGIRPASPGFKTLVIKPEIVGGLTWVNANYDSVHGRISSEWRQAAGQFDLRITIPANTTATVYLPAKDFESITESGKPVAQANGVSFLRRENDRVVLEVGSGTYQFASKIGRERN